MREWIDADTGEVFALVTLGQWETAVELAREHNPCAGSCTSAACALARAVLALADDGDVEATIEEVRASLTAARAARAQLAPAVSDDEIVITVDEDDGKPLGTIADVEASMRRRVADDSAIRRESADIQRRRT